MPESKRRRPKRNRRIRQRLAACDGERVPVDDGCCDGLEVEIGVGRMNVRHDDDCAALDDTSPLYVPARLVANAGVAQALSTRGIGPTLVVIAGANAARPRRR